MKEIRYGTGLYDPKLTNMNDWALAITADVHRAMKEGFGGYEEISLWLKEFSYFVLDDANKSILTDHPNERLTNLLHPNVEA